MSEQQKVVMADSVNQEVGGDLAKRLTLEAERQGRVSGFIILNYLDGKATSNTMKPQ